MGNTISHAILFLCVVFLFCIGPATAENTECEGCAPWAVIDREDHPDMITPNNTVTFVELSGTCDGFTSVATINNYVAAGAGDYSAQASDFSIRTNAGRTALKVATGIETQNSTVLTVATRAIDYAGTSANVKDTFFSSRCGDDDLSYCEEVNGGSTAVIRNGVFVSNFASIATPTNGMSLVYDYANGPTAKTNGSVGMVGEITSRFTTLQQYGRGPTLGANYESSFSSRMNGVSNTGGRFVFNSLQEA